MKVAITGAGGLLGSAFVNILSAAGHQTCAINRTTVANLNPNEIAERLNGVDWLLHAAANTDVELCEVDVESCYRDNVLLTELMADTARILGVPIVYISSTGVYGSYSLDPYAEYHEAHPTTHHHRAKLKGEQSVLSRAGGNLVIRTGWLFGGDTDNPKNFVARRIEEAREVASKGGILKSNQQQIGSPTAVDDVAVRVIEMIGTGHAGLFNCVNTGSASRLEYVQEIIHLAGLTVDLEAADAASFRRRAPVSNNEAATNWRMDCLGFEAMPCWQESLQSYVDSITHQGDDASCPLNM